MLVNVLGRNRKTEFVERREDVFGTRVSFSSLIAGGWLKLNLISSWEGKMIAGLCVIELLNDAVELECIFFKTYEIY